MTRTSDRSPDRDPTFATTDAPAAPQPAPAPAETAITSPLTINPQPAPTATNPQPAPTAAPAETAITSPLAIDPQPAPAVPADVGATAPPVENAPVTASAPERSAMPGDVNRFDGAAPATLAPAITADVTLGDPHVLDTGQAGVGQFGAGAIDLPAAGSLSDLPTTGAIDAGVDWNDLQGTGTLDGRGVDTFEGGAGASAPADPTAMVSEGGLLSWLFGSSTSTKPATEPTEPGAGAAQGDSGDGTDMSGLTTPGVKTGDDGVSTTTKQPTGEGAGMLKGLADFFMGKKNIDNTPTEREKQLQQIGPDTDGLPPDHPDYVGPASDRPLGSGTDESIERSLRQGLGGDRGGDVDPFDDPQANPEAGEQMFDPHDSVVNPGPDGFTVLPVIDASQLPDAGDLVDPYLADG